MLRKYLIAVGLSAAALGASIPSAASAQYYGYDNGPRTSFFGLDRIGLQPRLL